MEQDRSMKDLTETKGLINLSSTHRVRHWDLRVWHQFDFAFTGQIYIYNSVAIKADLQFLVCPQVMIFSIFICLTNNTLRRI